MSGAMRLLRAEFSEGQDDVRKRMLSLQAAFSALVNWSIVRSVTVPAEGAGFEDNLLPPLVSQHFMLDTQERAHRLVNRYS